MSFRNITIKANKDVPNCPKCGNNTAFAINSNQVAEDLCEVWAKCKCGFAPPDNGFEDVWGGVGDENALHAIRCYSDAVHDSLTPKP